MEKGGNDVKVDTVNEVDLFQDSVGSGEKWMMWLY